MSLILSGTDGISDVDGSASTPALRGTDANTGIFFPAADTIAFSEGGVESMRIDSAGNVGIGTSSPRFKLSFGSISAVSTATPDTVDLGATFSSSAGANGKLRIWYDGGQYMGLGVSSNQLDYIATGAYSHVWYSNSSERGRFTSGGYFKATNNGTYNNVSGSNHEFYNSANAETLIVRNANASFASEALIVSADRNTTNNSYYFLRLNVPGVANRLLIADSGSISTAGSVQLGDAGAPPTSGVGIKFPATQSASSDANTLDDYEEGTWTPSFASTGGGESLTYTGQRTGRYTKIGRVVYFQFDVELSAKSGGSGTARITGFPFTSENAPVTGGGTSIYWASTTTYAPAFGNIVLNTTVMDIRYGTVTDAQLFPWANITATTRLLMFGFYTVP